MGNGRLRRTEQVAFKLRKLILNGELQAGPALDDKLPFA